MMFYEKTIKLVTIISLILIFLWVMLIIGIKSGYFAFFGIESNPMINMALLLVLAVFIWIFMYFMFSIISSRIGLGLAIGLNNHAYLRVYRVYKFIVSKEARTAWEDDLKARGLID